MKTRILAGLLLTAAGGSVMAAERRVEADLSSARALEQWHVADKPYRHDNDKRVGACGGELLYEAECAGTPKSDIRTFSVGGATPVTCTVYPPTKQKGAKTAGLVIHLPGAGGGHTNYNLSRPPYAVLRQLLADRGYWIVVPSLGNSWMNNTAVTSLDKIIADMCEAEGIDPARVHIIGTSMGAGSGLIYVSQRPLAIRSICAIFPMTDFNAWMKETPRFAPSILQAYGSDQTTVEQIFLSRSPLRNPEAFARVPVYLLHGDKDDIVQPQHSRAFAAALRAKGCPVTYREVPGVGHEDKIAKTYQKEIADFLAGTLAVGNAAK